MRIWLDDCRPMPPDYDVHCYTVAEAKKLIETGRVTHISFDHDLGENDTGYDLAKWIETQAYHGTIPEMHWKIHSQNTVGATNILNAMKNADNYWVAHEIG